MQPQLSLFLARERQRALSAARGGDRDAPSRPLFASIALRLATANDREALERLAALDSAEPPSGSMLSASCSNARSPRCRSATAGSSPTRVWRQQTSSPCCASERGSSGSGVFDGGERGAYDPHRHSELIPGRRLLVYENAPHGLYLTHRKRLNADLLAFIEDLTSVLAA